MKFGQRWYDPYWGSWTQQDTLDSPLDPSNGNRYAYAAADPINGSDPTGRNAACLAGIAAGVGVAALTVAEIADIGASIATIPLTGGASVVAGADLAFGLSVELAAGVSFAAYSLSQC